MYWDRSQPLHIAAGVIAAPLLFVLLTLYCQFYDAGMGPPVPLSISMAWAATTATTWFLIGVVLWLARHRLLAAIATGRPTRFLGVALFIFGVALAIVGVVHGTSLLLQGLASSWSALVQPLLRLAPAVALVSGLATCLLYIHHRRQTPNDIRAEIPASPPASRPIASTCDWLPLPEEPRLLVRMADIKLIRSAGNYCEIYTDERVHLVRAPLKALGERVDRKRFAQVHRTAIVNLGAVKGLAEAPAGRRLELRLAEGTSVPVGRSYLPAIEQRLRSDIFVPS